LKQRHLAVDGHVSASTQNQSLAALPFLYEHVLAKPLNRLDGVVRAQRTRRLPVVLTRRVALIRSCHCSSGPPQAERKSSVAPRGDFIPPRGAALLRLRRSSGTTKQGHLPAAGEL
jgi:hypothetical protein